MDSKAESSNIRVGDNVVLNFSCWTSPEDIKYIGELWERLRFRSPFRVISFSGPGLVFIEDYKGRMVGNRYGPWSVKLFIKLPERKRPKAPSHTI